MYIDCSIFSKALQCNTNVKVFLPSNEADSVISGMPDSVLTKGSKFQALYLLHGAYDDNTMWPLCTNIRRYAQKRGLAVVMPSADNSFYHDLAYGAAYYTYISEELPQLMESYFCISSKPENRFICGNSMGGYGALYIGLRNPDRYHSIISLSGATDISMLKESRSNPVFNCKRILGDDPDLEKDTDSDLFRLAEKQKEAGAALPSLLLICGTEDFLIADNRKANDCFARLGFDISYREYPGEHGWPFWEKHIEEALDWLPLTGHEVRE